MTDNAHVNVAVVELVRGKDRKLYPADLPHTHDQRLRAVALSHTLRCGRKLTYARIREALASEFGVRRSVGMIFRDVREYRCPLCTPQPPAPPDPAQRARVAAWR